MFCGIKAAGASVLRFSLIISYSSFYFSFTLLLFTITSHVNKNFWKFISTLCDIDDWDVDVDDANDKGQHQQEIMQTPQNDRNKKTMTETIFKKIRVCSIMFFCFLLFFSRNNKHKRHISARHVLHTNNIPIFFKSPADIRCYSLHMSKSKNL